VSKFLLIRSTIADDCVYRDPIDAGAIVSVIANQRTSSDPLYLGSVKSNLGFVLPKLFIQVRLSDGQLTTYKDSHLEGASGLMSFIKCVMMLENETILPNANFIELNPKIEGGERLRVRVHRRYRRHNLTEKLHRKLINTDYRC